MNAAGPGSKSFSFWSAILASWVSWIVLVGTVGWVAGGRHLTDEERDSSIMVGAVLIGALNFGVVIALFDRFEKHAPIWELVTGSVMVVLHIVVAIVVLRFLATIHHDPGIFYR